MGALCALHACSRFTAIYVDIYYNFADYLIQFIRGALPFKQFAIQFHLLL